ARARLRPAHGLCDNARLRPQDRLGDRDRRHRRGLVGGGGARRVRRTLERIGLVVVTALIAASATAYASRGSTQAGFVNVRPGQEVRFLGTNVTCVAPK